MLTSSQCVRFLSRLMSTGGSRDLPAFTTHLHDHTISYVRSGSGPQPVLLLPGALGSAKSDFTPTIQGINSKNELTVIAWDPPGYGDSRPPARTFPDPNFFDRDAKFAVDLMKTLGFDRFSAVGWSDGGITAMAAAAEYPTKVQKLVFWGANAFITKTDIEHIRAVKDVSQWSERMRKPMEEMYGVDGFPKLWAQWCEAYEKFFQEKDGDICAKRLSKIQCPTLIIHGDKDAMVDPVHPDHLNKNIAGSILHRMPDGKHNLHFKYAKEFNKLVEDFLISNQ